MTKFEELKKEINEMSLDDFIKHIVAEGAKDYICSDIKHPNAFCTKKQEYNCEECIKAYLKLNAE